MADKASSKDQEIEYLLSKRVGLGAKYLGKSIIDARMRRDMFDIYLEDVGGTYRTSIYDVLYNPTSNIWDALFGSSDVTIGRGYVEGNNDEEWLEYADTQTTTMGEFMKMQSVLEDCPIDYMFLQLSSSEEIKQP